MPETKTYSAGADAYDGADSAAASPTKSQAFGKNTPPRMAGKYLCQGVEIVYRYWKCQARGTYDSVIYITAREGLLVTVTGIEFIG